MPRVRPKRLLVKRLSQIQHRKNVIFALDDQNVLDARQRKIVPTGLTIMPTHVDHPPPREGVGLFGNRESLAKPFTVLRAGPFNEYPI